MNIRSVVALRPSLSKNQLDRLGDSFRSAKSTKFSLLPTSEAQLASGNRWSSDGVLQASVNCKQRVQMEFRGGDRPPPVEHSVAVIVERTAGKWKIVSIE